VAARTKACRPASDRELVPLLSCNRTHSLVAAYLQSLWRDHTARVQGAHLEPGTAAGCARGGA